MFNKLSENPEIGLGYLIVPKNMNRGEYIRRCYNTNSVFLFTEMFGVFNNVTVGKNFFDLVNFPEVDKLGTAVLWCREPYQHNTYVIQVLSRDIYSGFDSGQSIGASEGGNQSFTSYSAKNGTMFTKLESQDRAIAKMIIASPNNSALLKTEVKGSIENISNEFLIETGTEVRLTVNGEENHTSVTLDENTAKINSTTIELGEAKDPMVSGSNLYLAIENILTEFENTTVRTPFGRMPIYNKDQVNKLRELLDTLLSERCFMS